MRANLLEKLKWKVFRFNARMDLKNVNKALNFLNNNPAFVSYESGPTIYELVIAKKVLEIIKDVINKADFEKKLLEKYPDFYEYNKTVKTLKQHSNFFKSIK